MFRFLLLPSIIKSKQKIFVKKTRKVIFKVRMAHFEMLRLKKIQIVFHISIARNISIGIVQCGKMLVLEVQSVVLDVKYVKS